MLIAAIQQRGDLSLLTWSSLLQTLMWGTMSCIYWVRRDQGKASFLQGYIGSLDIWICTFFAVAWAVGFVLFIVGHCKKGFGGGPSFRMLIVTNGAMTLASVLFFLAAALAVSGRFVMLFSHSVADLSGLLSFCLGSLLAYIALLLTAVCLLVGRAAIAA